MAASGSEAVKKALGDGARRSSLGILATGAGVLAVAAAGLFLAFQFVAAERERALADWRERMNIIADSRFADMRGWLDAQMGEMRGLAQNQSLQLYMTLLYEAGVDATSPDAPPELGYLANLLAVVADRAGFQAAIGGPNVAANVARTGSAGIALIDPDGRVVVASPGMPPIEGALGRFLAGVAPGESGLSDLFTGPAGTPSMAFAAPVFAIQGDASAASQVATVLGVREVADALFPLLAQPGDTNETAETLLVAQDGSTVLYLTPRRDGTPALEGKVAMREELAAAWAIRTPQGFAVKENYAAAEVLAVSRAFARVPWTMLYTVETAEALAETERRLTQLVYIFVGLIVLVIAGGLALWYYGSSRRASEAAENFEKLATRFQGQRDFMHLVTDSQPNLITIFDEGGHYRWFNQRTLDLVRVERRDLFDKHVTAILGPGEGKRVGGWVKETLAKNEPMQVTHSLQLSEDTEGRVYTSSLIPLPPRDGMPAGALMVSQDITQSVRDRERREAAMRQLVDTLVSVVDRRDPFAANHSTRVGEVARAIGAEIEADPGTVEAAGIAGSLMNLGKITIPSDVLTKEGALSEEERTLLREIPLVSGELVQGVDFEGPVAETLAQLGEAWDGSGFPKGLAGEEILLSARIAAVANAFVGLVSARAWRAGTPFDKAIDILLSDSGKRFDRSVVVALANLLDNRGARARWADFADAPDAAAD